MRRLGNRARWAVPIGATAAVGVIVAASAVASASVPSLPSRSVAQLLTSAEQAAARPRSPMTATVQESTSLGLPALPASGPLTGVASGLASLSGSHSINIWYLNPLHVRVSEPVSMGESDLRLDGSQLWLWNSKTQTATHVLLPPNFANGSSSASYSPVSSAAATAIPDVRQLLAALGPSTSIRVGQNASVAGQAAYQLVIAPKASGSLVSQIVVALDASNYLPLRWQVFARGVASPVIQAGYTSLSFGRPAASNFSFTPPRGATVKTERVPDKAPSGLLGSGALAGLGSSGLLGSISAPQAVTPGPYSLSGGSLKQVVRSFAASLPASMPAAQRASAIKAFTKQIALPPPTHVSFGSSGTSSNGGVSVSAPSSSVGQPTVVGKFWLSVLVTPPSPEIAATVKEVLASQTASGGRQEAYSSGPSSTQFVIMGPSAVPDPALLRALLRSSTPVSGSWGSGRLLRTSLVSILITSNGRILAGAVTPAVLYADAAGAR